MAGACSCRNVYHTGHHCGSMWASTPADLQKPHTVGQGLAPAETINLTDGGFFYEYRK